MRVFQPWQEAPRPQDFLSGAPCRRPGPVWLGTWLAAEVAERTEDTGPRLLCGPRRTYLGDWSGVPGRHGETWRRPKSCEMMG